MCVLNRFDSCVHVWFCRFFAFALYERGKNDYAAAYCHEAIGGQLPTPFYVSKVSYAVNDKDMNQTIGFMSGLTG